MDGLQDVSDGTLRALAGVLHGLLSFAENNLVNGIPHIVVFGEVMSFIQDMHSQIYEEGLKRGIAEPKHPLQDTQVQGHA